MTAWLALASEAVLAAGLSTAAMTLALAFSRLGPPPNHWTERAREAWAARLAGRLGALTATAFAPAIVYLFSGGATALPSGVHLTAVILAAAAPALVLSARRERALTTPELPWGTYLRGRLAYSLALRGQILVLVVLAGFAFAAPSFAAIPLVLLGALSAIGFARGMGVDLALRLGMARPASPELAARLASRPGADAITATHVLNTQVANALALPACGRLVFTQGTLDATSPDEQDAIADHELGHLNEPPSVVRARVGLSLVVTPLVALGPLGRHDSMAAVGLVLGVVVLLSLGRRLQTRMEERADAHAHEGDPTVYARALERLYEHNKVPAVLGKAPHPDLYDRLVSAGVAPEWPRPAPPPKWRPRLAVAGAIFLVGLTVVPLRVALDRLAESAPDSPAAWIWGGPAR